MYKGFKKKKGVNLQVDDKRGHLYLSSEESPRLLMLRPIDVIEFAEFGGANAEDILIWVGKTIGKYFLEESELSEEELASMSMSEKKEMLLDVLDILQQLGYGVLTLTCKKSDIFIRVDEALTQDEKDNIMAKNLCYLYQGIFNGIIEFLQIDADGTEEECSLMGGDACIFRYEMLIDEFDDEDIDEEKSKEEGITGFLGSL